MGKKKFSILERADGEELTYQEEYSLNTQDMVVPTDIPSTDTVTIADGESLVVKRRFKISGVLRIEGTGRLGVV